MNPHGLKTRKAKPSEDYSAPSNTVHDNKRMFGWPRCVYLAYVPGDEAHALLLCGGGQTPAEALASAVERIERIGVHILKEQQIAARTFPVSTMGV